MSDYRIVCTNQTGCTTGGHIVGVGTGSDAGWDRQWTLQQVYDAMNAMNMGDRFLTYGGGLWAEVEPYHCKCGLWTLRSGPDATTANNLDTLNLCRLSA